VATSNLTSPEGEVFEATFQTAPHVFGATRAPGAMDQSHRLLATKEGEIFCYSDATGNMVPASGMGMGLYYRDTRFLSGLVLTLSDEAPVLLSSSAERAYMSYMDTTNSDIWDGAHLVVAQQTLSLRRIRAIHGRMYERVRVKNYSDTCVRVRVQMSFAADFADIFEVRGLRRKRRGAFAVPRLEPTLVRFAYRGEDEVYRETRINFDDPPDAMEEIDSWVRVTYEVALEPGQTRMLGLAVQPRVGQDPLSHKPFDVAVHELRRSYEDWERSCTDLYTDNELFNTMLHRGLRDLRALETTTPHGPVLAAGIPWYVAVFGRDSLLASHQILAVNPDCAKDTLRVLAAYQGRQLDPWRDEEPGKILHEIRLGELAGAFYVPHSPYFGSVDSTPLFLMLLGTLYKWTGDLDFCREMLPAVEGCLSWIRDYGDMDGDGFVEYLRRSPRGLANQGWKDSGTAICHPDGTPARGPIALAEVQGYVYMAKFRIADIFDALGDQARAGSLRAEAERLKKDFNEAFWNPEEGYFAMALDGDKRQVTTVASNPGHGFYCDIIAPEHAELTARRLLQPDMFSGWGVRTMAKSAAAYNPMSYHNGSVWPHDNAIIAAGLKRYGFHKATNRIATALFDTARLFEYQRLPELFCGFTRRSPNRPVAYPVACSPQAWAAGTPFLLLQAMLGLSARAPENLLTVNKPVLPSWLNTVEVRNLRVGRSRISLVFRREGEITGFSLMEKEGDVRVVMEE